MKEITYKNLEDYLKVGESYADPKIVKIYETTNAEMLNERLFAVVGVTFMRTWLFQFYHSDRKKSNIDEIAKRLREAGHMEGKIREVIPTGKYLG